jgi:hypothetical protein
MAGCSSPKSEVMTTPFQSAEVEDSEEFQTEGLKVEARSDMKICQSILDLLGEDGSPTNRQTDGRNP